MNYHVLAIGRRRNNLLQTKQASVNPDNIDIYKADIGSSHLSNQSISVSFDLLNSVSFDDHSCFPNVSESV